MSGTRAPTTYDRPPTTLPRIFDGPGLPDHRDLDLAGILELRLDLLGHVAGEPERLVVRDAVAWSAAAVLQPVAGVVDPTDVARLAAQTLVEDVR